MRLRITHALQALSPALGTSLRPSASEEEIAELETALGTTLPDALRLAYACHDGQSNTGPGMFGGYRWLSIEGVLGEWRVEQELLDAGDFDELNMGEVGTPVRMDWWNPRWIPFARSLSGDLLCADLAPGRSGRLGQVISVYHDDDTRAVLADDFAACLESAAA